MEKDIAKIPKNNDTDIIIRIDDFGGRTGLTIREFVKGERYTGFTKAGTRIPADKFTEFKHAINSINEKDLQSQEGQSEAEYSSKPNVKKEYKTSKPAKEEKHNESSEDFDDYAM